MDMDDVAPTGSSMFFISLLYEPDYLCSRFFFFSAGQPSVVDPAPLPRDESGSTHGKSRSVIYATSLFSYI